MNSFGEFFHSSKNIMFTVAIVALHVVFLAGLTYTPMGAAPEVELPVVTGDHYITALLSLCGLFVTGKGLEYGLKREE